ncbi:MAG TPA: peptidase M61, partial [Burkholderiaceae bacterium]
SSENGVQPGYFDDWDKHLDRRQLLPHEYAHSWNGKFRRPADLWTRNYNEPMRNSLLWVYEGQTEYWGQVLGARSGLVDEALTRDHWAEIGAWSEFHHRRAWRSLQDTVSEPAIVDADRDWPDWQGRQDYYTDAALVWLEADMLIRERTQGRRSLDDFARRFFGVEGDRIAPLTYRFEDVVAALDDVLPHDWAGFLRQRLDAVGGPSLAPALERSGWRLAWSETESETQRANRRGGEVTHHFRYSIGLTISPKDATIKAVEWDSPAFAAGLAGGTHVVAVNMEVYKPERLAQAITANKDGSRPIELLVKDGDRYRLVRIDYRGGLRYPALERIPGTPDLLAAQMAPSR